MKHFLIFTSLLLVFSLSEFNKLRAVSSKYEQPLKVEAPISITHYNVIITPDLSNRLLRPKPVSDAKVVGAILDGVLPKVLTYKRTTDQKDRYSVSFVSKQAISQYGIKTENLKISFDQFKNQLQRIDYVKNRGTLTLAADRKKFAGEFSRVTQAAAKAPDGADLWSYFNQGIDYNILKNDEKPFQFNGKTFVNRHRNIMVLLTDGYVEAGLYGKNGCTSGNKCYYLSSQRIKTFRAAFKKSGMRDIKQFFQKGNYGIIPANNPHLKNLEVLVLQMEDRSLTKSGSATVHPTDMDIMKLFWSDWLTKSKVKRFEMRPIVASQEDAEREVLRFMGVQ